MLRHKRVRNLPTVQHDSDLATPGSEFWAPNPRSVRGLLFVIPRESLCFRLRSVIPQGRKTLLWDNNVSSLWGQLSVPDEFLGHYFQEAKYWKGMLQPLHRPVWLTDCGILSTKHKNESLFLVGNRAGEHHQQKGWGEIHASEGPVTATTSCSWSSSGRDRMGKKQALPLISSHANAGLHLTWGRLHLAVLPRQIKQLSLSYTHTHAHSHAHSHFAFLVLAEKHCVSRRPKNQTTASVLTALSFANFSHSQPPQPLLSHLKVCTCLEFDSFFFFT